VGGRRLRAIEPDLAGAFILGVDEHTALILDLDAATAEVAGRGGVTLRVAGLEDVLPSGSALPISDLEDRVRALGAVGAIPARGAGGHGRRPGRPSANPGSTPVGAPAAAGADAIDDLARTVLAALPDSSPRARAALVALAGRAEESAAAQDRDLAGRLVQALVDVRLEARARGDWAASDHLREVLAAAGIEVRDTREGTEWAWR
jgi:hypothetical protein